MIRVMKPQPIVVKARGRQIIGDEFHWWPGHGTRRKSVFIRDAADQCPFARPGDKVQVEQRRLWWGAIRWVWVIERPSSKASEGDPNHD